MTNEPNGPYKLIRDILIAGPGIGPKFLGEKEVLPALNAAWLAGRASRDGLRAALVRLRYVSSGVDTDIIDEALAEDEKNGGGA
ncbi:MAG: hypothetical protein E6Q97_35035 [Desulfurellales bacterium]|nr:MAG: hypothetical protein E6Q97_35035 [Desulfurellales bacterium]